MSQECLILSSTMKKKKYWLLWGITFLYIGFIWSNSLAQGSDSGDLSQKVTTILLSFVEKTGFTIQFDLFHHYVRKLAHFSEYFLLAFWVYLSNHKAKVSIPMPLLAWVLVPAIDETIQHFVPDRFGALSDVLLDMCGYLTGYFCTYVLCLIVVDLLHKYKKSH